MNTELELLRFSTTGSVDDGKSTLLGRLLYETRCIFEDQYSAIENASQKRGYQETDLSLLLDGLSSEREQGITIDVAYRYFHTHKRRFIVSDTPGHEQYTRNMVSGASNVDLAIILIDASRGMSTQSRRHGFILSLLQIPHVLVAINKMDAVDYDENVYRQLREDYLKFCEKLKIPDLQFIPVSALRGENITRRSEKMPWYRGSTLLHMLENTEVRNLKNLVDFRFPVQWVSQPNHSTRAYAGKVSSGHIRKGEEILILPSGQSTRVKEIFTFDGNQSEASVGEVVSIQTEDERDISRGDMLVRPQNMPLVTQDLDCMLCWLSESPLDLNKSYYLKQSTRSVRVQFKELNYHIDVNTLSRNEATTLKMNEIGRAQLVCHQAVIVDAFERNRATGSFVLIDEDTANTVAAGMVRGRSNQASKLPDFEPAHIYPESINPSRSAWEERNQHKSAVLWLTGLSGAGKSTVARALTHHLFEQQYQVINLDGDNIRKGLCHNLGFSADERKENIRRTAAAAELFFEQGNLVVCSFISPFQADRDAARALFPVGRFYEVFVDCPLEVCQARDPKGLYEKALSGEIKGFTGISSPYEAPTAPELHLRSDRLSVTECLESILNRLKNDGIL